MKLTGPPPKSSEKGGARDEPNEQHANSDEGGNPTPQLSGKSFDDSSGTDNGERPRIPFKSKRSQQNKELTSSMIKIVKNAAETARLVLDQAALNETVVDENKSVSSHGSCRSSGTAHSIHSYHSIHSHDSQRPPGNMSGIELSGPKLEGSIKEGGGNMLEGNGRADEQMLAENSFTMQSESSGDIITTGPPPTAFNNLPMARGFTTSHKSGESNGVLPKGKVFEVTTHYDAAAAISAALASSHLAQAAGNLGELQMPKHSYAPARRRSAGEKTLGHQDQPTPKVQRSNSGDATTICLEAMEGISHHPIAKELGGKQDDPPLQRRPLPTKEEAQAEMLLNRTSFVSVDDLSFGSNDKVKVEKIMEAFSSSGGHQPNLIREEKQLNDGKSTIGSKEMKITFSPTKIRNVMKPSSKKKDPLGKEKDSPQHRRWGKNLPTREEAEAEMLSKRTSFLSVDDISFDSGQEQMLIALQRLKKGDAKQATKDDKRNAKNDDQNLKQDKQHAEISTDKKDQRKVNGEPHSNDKQADTERRDITAPLKSDDSASGCSSSGYENESNTSSVYGSNTNSGYSDVSPMTLSTDDNKQSGVGGVNKKGMLGNLASSRRANLGVSNHSYEGVDDDYSTHSENSGGHKAGKQQHIPQRQVQEQMDGKAKTVTFSPKSTTMSLVGSSNIRKPQAGMLFNGSSVGAKKSDEPSVSSSVKEYAASTPKERHSVLQKQLSAAPAHRVSLFDSFDRNWEQAVRNAKDPEAALALGRKCFASFAIVFGSCEDGSGRSIFSGAATNNSGEAEGNPSAFRWWVDENALTNAHGPGSLKENGSAGEHEGCPQGIPLAVVRTLWMSCFFDAEQDNVNSGEGDADDTLDLIQHTLVKELCYLNETATRSASCLRLSLDVYAEYGRYILRRFGMQDQIASWHSKFSVVLRGLLLDGSLTDADSITKRRYAAQSLPRHVAIGFLGVDSEGHFQMEEEKRTELQTALFKDILCDRGFIKSRAELLGRGNARPGDLDETLDAGGGSPRIVKFIKQIRGIDRNLLFSTTALMKDMEWCTSFCVPDGDDSAERQAEQNEAVASLFSDCLDAMTEWKEELVASFRLLHISGKLTISDNSTEPNVPSRPEDKVSTAADQLAELVSYYKGSIGETPGSESCIDAAKSLLATDDAWTMKDDSAEVFKGDSSKEFMSPRPPWKARRKRADQKEGTAAATSLARVLSINVSDLRTAVSAGRSLIGLAEFSQNMLDKEIFRKELKDSSSVTLRVHAFQSSCLKNAIEVLSCSAVTLGYILSSSLDSLDEDDLDETVTTNRPHLQLFAMTREASKPLLSIAGILSADAWFSLGKLVSKACKSEDGSHVMLFSFERALHILNSPKSASLNKPALDLLCESILSPLTQYKCFLQSNVNHSIGVHSYEQGDFEGSFEHLDKASKFRRRLLDDLRGQDGENADNSNGLSKLFNAVVGGMKNNYLVSPSTVSEEVFTNVFKYSIGHGCAQLPRESFAIEELELSLSLTLEYSALTHHAGQKYQQALSFFQESLILRTIHVGKHSLDVASLHFNMGVVYDDLEQYDQAISRYHESLRIRLDQMNKAASPKIISELVLTLKCLGHVYKIIDDIDNAVCCYVKASEMVNKKFSMYREHVDEWSLMGMRLGLAVPVPTIIFDDMKPPNGDTSWKTHFQLMNKKELCHVFEPRGSKRRSRSTVTKLKKELAKLHSTVVELVHERKQKDWGNVSKPSRFKLTGSSLLLASISSTFKSRGDAFEAALMRSSFSLGRMKLEQMRYEEAAELLESALRSKWVLDPASSSDSDSDFSRISLSSRGKQQAKCMDEDDPEEGQLYYALGICNAALDDHERAVRCFLTAMRYLRRSLRKVDSLEVARVLFDCATSHYYLCNFDQSVSLYGECLRILESYDATSDEGDKEKSPSDENDVSKSNSFRRGIVLYCIVMAKASIDFDSEASNLLNEAQTLLSGCDDKIILAYMEFLTGLFLHHAACQVPVRLRSITRITSTGLSLNEGLNWNEMCNSALTLLEQVKNECWFDPLEGVEDSDEVKHLPLSGHICFKKGQVYELIDSVDQALNSYVDATNFYRIACGDENMYVASVLHRMGRICSQRTEYHALGYYNEALSIRKNLLGGNDRLVADTLFHSAVVLARLNRYEASMERYHEALRIQMADSQDSNEVARTLAGMGICHYNHKAFDLALTCLEGAVKIRKYRVSRLTDSSELVELYGEEVALGADFFNLGNVHMQMGDYAQAMQCYIQSRDLRWRHVGSGTVDKIMHKYFSEVTVDEDELLGLAHCLHNIGVMFDIKKEYGRSLPHYEEALVIKNAIAGFTGRGSLPLAKQVNPDENQALVLQSLYKDHDFPKTNRATLSASVTRQKIATVYAKQRKYDDALFHFSHALRIQRHVLGKDNFRIGSLLSSMGKALRQTPKHADTAVICYNESVRISKLRFGPSHETVALALYDIGSLYDSNKRFGKAMHYYQRALSVYKEKYSEDLRARLCSGLDRPRALMSTGGSSTEILSTGDEIVVSGSASAPEKHIREQYVLVAEALRTAKRQDMINRGERRGWVGDSSDAWLTFEILLFRFVEMLSTYIVDPAQTVVRDTIDSSRRSIESAAGQAVISAADVLDYQFLLLMQE